MDVPSTLTPPSLETQSPPPEPPISGARAAKSVEALLLLIASIFWALHLVHLRADFPNHSPWMDWAKYTDEGWYGDAAIRHYQLGHWNVPGDFNAAAALPVWPALELVLFRFTGVSLAAARALTVVVFGLTLLCCYMLIRRWPIMRRDAVTASGSRKVTLAPAIAVLLLSVSPYCYALSRLAILEPLLILLTLIAALVATAAGTKAPERSASDSRVSLRSAAWTVVLGLLLPAMVLTKTTGVFVFPAIAWLLWASSGYRVRPFLCVALPSGAVGALAWSAYYGLFVRPHYLLDYRYLFSANAYTGITRATLWPVLSDAFTDVGWIGATLAALALTAVVASLAGLALSCLHRFAHLRQNLLANPLVVALLLWVFGYGAFLAYHANLQPRYYLVLAIPLTMLVAMGFDALVTFAMAESSQGTAPLRRWTLSLLAAIASVALAFAAIHGGSQTIAYVRNPEYTWVNAAAQLEQTIDRQLASPEEAGHSRLVLSISGSDLSLMTGLPSICDDFGTMTLPERLAAYKPGWFATWNHVEDDKMEALAPMYRLVRVMAVPAFDDPERNLLILYRLDPIAVPGQPGRPGRRRSLSVPRKLRTKVGEQPTLQQLTH